MQDDVASVIMNDRVRAPLVRAVGGGERNCFIEMYIGLFEIMRQ